MVRIKNIVINGVEYQPITQKNSSRVARLIQLYTEIRKMTPRSGTLMVHGFRSEEFSEKDWDKSESGSGENSFDHKRFKGLYCFTNDKYDGRK